MEQITAFGRTFNVCKPSPFLLKSTLVSDVIKAGGKLIFNPEDGFTTLLRPEQNSGITVKTHSGQMLSDLTGVPPFLAAKKIVGYMQLNQPFVVQKGTEVRVFTPYTNPAIFMETLVDLWN